MADRSYVPRHLEVGDEIISERDLLNEPSVVIVLAEPGAGKTDLLDSIASANGIHRIRASVFQHRKIEECEVLVIDALDEVTRTSPESTNAIISKAQESGARWVVFASRSSEWEDARTRFVQDCFERRVKVARLRPFNQSEQEQIFASYQPLETFRLFFAESRKFELDPLLANPQFLKLFADAYVEGDRHFESKRKIFQDAIRRLASEENPGVSQRLRPPINQIISDAEEIFAKLLLSGSAGISTVEALSEPDYPFLNSLTTTEPGRVSAVLDTRLFKLVDDGRYHEPVHRIVAEYCAAHYLVKRIDDQRDRFSLRRCLAIIAPNSVVRDELRGMLGWMAALGGQSVQDAAIDLDPYAVMANGDPSQLSDRSRQRLMKSLSKLAESDPFFRRGDFWRTFSCAGFFTDEVLADFRLVIPRSEQDSQLRDMLLEMVRGSNAAVYLQPELRQIVFDPTDNHNSRLLAYDSLSQIVDRDKAADFNALLNFGDETSLKIATEILQEDGDRSIGRDLLLSLIRKLAELYQKGRGTRTRYVGSRLFIKQLIETLSLDHTTWLLEELTEDLRCTCDPKHDWNCKCRQGTSKVMGALLDRHFEMANADAEAVWRWTKDLHFDQGISAENSRSVAALIGDDGLRQAIQMHALGEVTDPELIWEMQRRSFSGYAHAGLRIQPQDHQPLIDHAFLTNNVALWSAFSVPHNDQTKDTWKVDLRSHMRQQANEKPVFGAAWAKQDKYWKKTWQEHRLPQFRSVSRQRRRRLAVKRANQKGLAEHLSAIEAGRHWGWLQLFADHYLLKPGDFEKEFGDPSVMERSLLNSFPFLQEYTPSLQDLAVRRGGNIIRVLHAACLATYRLSGSLSEIATPILEGVKTDLWTHGSKDEATAFEAEIDRHILTTHQQAEDFARRFIEPQLAGSSAFEKHTEVGWLRHKPEFQCLQSKLPLEWLRHYPCMPYSSMDTLFQIAVQQGDRAELVSLVEARCSEYFFFWPEETDNEDLERRRLFWFVRAFFFSDAMTQLISSWLKRDPQNIFPLESRAARFNREQSVGWPSLSAAKAYLVMDAFVDGWPKVDLPSSFGTGSPPGEVAYRFLSDVIWALNKDTPENAIAVADKILSDSRFKNYRASALNIRADSARRLVLRDFAAPSPDAIVAYLEHQKVATAEDLRSLVLELLQEIQVWIGGAPTDPIGYFYDGGRRVDENTATKRVAEHLQLRLNALNISASIEHHMINEKRCDLTATAVISRREIMMVCEAKGQWHPELFTAASEQLATRYTVHPSAVSQGIYLVFWYGPTELIAGKKNTTIRTSEELRASIERQMPPNLAGAVDVFVLDVSRTP